MAVSKIAYVLAFFTAIIMPHFTECQSPSFTPTADEFGTPHLYSVLVNILGTMQLNHNQTMGILRNQQETLDQIAETQTQMANTFHQVAAILQMGLQQVQNITATMDTAVTVLEDQQESLENISQSIPFILQQQEKTSELLERQLSASINNSAVESMLGNQPVALPEVTDILHNLTATLTQQLDIETQILLQQDGPRDCSNIASTGYPREYVYCNAKTDGNGWTVFQRRYDGSINFYRGWEDYENGFGSPNGEYWAGLRKIHEMVQSGHWILRVELEAFDRSFAYAEYDSFKIGNATSNYTLSIGSYSGDAGDSLGSQNNTQFTTYDCDNDNWSDNCAEYQKGAWWHRVDCGYSNLNGIYGKSSSNEGMWWYHWKGVKSLRKSVMKIKRME